MKKKHLIFLFSLMAALALVFALSLSSVWAGSLEGDGSPQDPYRIYDYDDLQEFGNLVNGGQSDACAIVMKSFDTGGYGDWVPLVDYAGTLDGQGNVIFSLSSYATLPEKAGLVGTLDGGTICNLKLADTFIYGRHYSGGIAGYMKSGTIENCAVHWIVRVHGSSSAQDSYVGGIAGYVEDGVIINCHNDSDVQSVDCGQPCSYNGGLVGYIEAGDISYCYNFNSVVSSGPGVIGGLAGKTEANATITDCYCWDEGCATVIGEDDGADLDVAALAEDDFASASNFPGWDFSADWIMGDRCPLLRSLRDCTIILYPNDGTDDKYYMTAYVKEDFILGACPYAMDGHYFIDWNTRADGNGKTYANRQMINLRDNLILWAQWGEVTLAGSGTAADPYQINDYDELVQFAEIVNGGRSDVCAELLADIDAAGHRDWNPIGFDLNSSFDGVFNGNGHTISNLSNEDLSKYPKYAGLVGCMFGGGVRDLNLENVNLRGTNFTGGVVGYIGGWVYPSGPVSGTVENCRVSGTVRGACVGGVAGYNWGTVNSCAVRPRSGATAPLRAASLAPTTVR